MPNEYYIREACSKAIANKLAKRAHDYVSDDMIKCRQQLLQVQADFNAMVEDAAQQLLGGTSLPRTTRVNEWGG